MKRFTWLSLFLAGFVLCALSTVARAGENPGFEKMKSLVGEWEGLTEEMDLRVSYRKELAYSFVGGTNMAGPAAPHMHNLVVSFKGGDHFTQEWTWRDKGKETTTTFHFKRKASS